MGETWLLTARRLHQGAGGAARERARAYRIRLIEPAQLIDLRAEIGNWMGIEMTPGTPRGTPDCRLAHPGTIAREAENAAAGQDRGC
jgi:hypothetical protein